MHIVVVVVNINQCHWGFPCLVIVSFISDRTAKIWDLSTGEEILTLGGHPNNVGHVRFNPETGLVYTTSTYMTKVWDLRDQAQCIKTLTYVGEGRRAGGLVI